MTQKAQRATIKLGDIELDVFLLSNGEYRFSATGIAAILGLSSDKRVRQILTSKSLKAKTAITLGLGKNDEFKLTFDKISIEECGNINAISIDLLMLIVNYEAFKNDNEKAQLILEAALAEALERRADSAFHHKRSEDEYNARLVARIEGKKVRWDFTDSIKAYITRNNITGNKAKFMYKNVTDRLYKNLTGHITKKLKEVENIPVNATPRDYCSDRDLEHIKQIEAAAQR